MLVGYSSSSDEESEAATERIPTESLRILTLVSNRLSLPGCLLAMFPEEVYPQTEDSTLHGGRTRSFKHERGNWATYVYLPYPPEEDFGELLEELLSVARVHGVILTPQEEFHLSLSQTVVLRHHWIQPFTQSLRKALVHHKRFACSAERLKVYCNAERTRTFLGMEVCTGQAQLLHLVQAVDRTMTEFELDTFYKDPSFHLSLAWCVGDVTEQMNECLQSLQGVVTDHEDGPFVLRLDCTELRCRTGNKTFQFPLKP
uniref:U6 snRNA phosphodiesterase n=1 Tax=Mola mola TaxID=94237 RepID=A0A3Q3VIU0_MOLML